MKLRPLKEKDAIYMLEWMHDDNVSGYLGKNFAEMTIDNCKAFIANAKTDEDNIHFAITDDSDEYMGTISLKNIDYNNKRAEYAISCRTKAMGKGFATFATEELFKIAKDKMGLELIYLNVYDYNIRAQKLYKKTGFTPVECFEFIKEETDKRLLWFAKYL